MRKIYTPFIFCLFATLFINAQSTYIKMLKEDTTTWQFYGIVPGVSPKAMNSNPFFWMLSGSYGALDTISFGGIRYRKFYLLNNYGSYLYYNGKSLVGYLREDSIGKKVYYRENAVTSDILLYDFNQNVNDSSYWTFPNNSSLSGYYRIDSIVIRNEFSGPRKHFYYRKHVGNSNPNLYYFDNIEGIGSSYHIAYIFTYGLTSLSNWFSAFQPPTWCNLPWDVGLACKHNDQLKQYQSCTSTFNIWGTHSDPCVYFLSFGGLKTNDWENLVKIGPNPSSDKIEVSVDQSFADINCSVTDMTGKVVLNFPKSAINTEKNSFVFSSRDLAPGVYIVQVDLNGTLIKRPVIIQH